MTLKASHSPYPLTQKLRTAVNPRLRANPVVTEGIPSSILHLAIEKMKADMVSFIDEFTRPNSAGPELYRRTFRSMSLVHSSWLIPSQRALHHRVILTSDNSIARFLANPHCGPLVREVWITQREGSTSDSDDEEYASDDTNSSDESTVDFETSIVLSDGGDRSIVRPRPRCARRASISPEEVEAPLPARCILIANLLLRTPNIRFLSIDIGWYKEESTPNGLESVLRAIAQMPHLEGLSLLPHSNHNFAEDQTGTGNAGSHVYPHSLSLFKMLPQLHKLRYLHLGNWTCLGKDVAARLAPQLLRLSPPANLTTVIIDAMDNPIPPSYMQWLLTPHGESAVKRLAVRSHTYDGRNLVKAPLLFGSAFYSIESLILDVHPSVSCQIDAVDNLLARCKSIRQLELSCVPLLGLRIPPTVEELSIRRGPYETNDFPGKSFNLQDVDKEVHGFINCKLHLSAIPVLRKIVLSLDYKGLCAKSQERTPKAMPDAEFPLTTRICRQSDIEFVIKKRSKGDPEAFIAGMLKLALDS